VSRRFWSNVFAVAYREARIVRHDRAFLGVVLMQPIMMLVIFGLVLSNKPANVPWAVQFPTELLDNADQAQVAINQCSRLNPNLDSVAAIIDAARTNPQVREILSHILTPRHPSQLYEALLEGVLLFVCLITIRLRFRKPDGLTTGCFFLLYPIMRIIGEIFRVPDAPLTGPFTRGQFLSLFMFLIALGFFWRVWKSRPKEMTNDR